jgi:hypothetical protein
MISYLRILAIIFVISLLFAEEIKEKSSIHPDVFRYSTAGKIGDNPFPTNPMNLGLGGGLDATYGLRNQEESKMFIFFMAYMT